jgi:hypothetical protein
MNIVALVWMKSQESDWKPTEKTRLTAKFNYSTGDHFEALILFRLILLTA